MMTSSSKASTTTTFFFGRDFPRAENEADMPLSTSFPASKILESVRLEMPVAAVSLEPTLYKAFLYHPLSRPAYIHVHTS
jgi:hypothetical protein